MSLIDLVQQHLGADGVRDIAQQLGTDQETTAQAIQAALPMMVGGMAHTAQQPEGENAIQSAISSLGSGGIGGVLGSILGQQHSTVQDGVEQQTGMDSGKVAKLLMLLAPFVIRALAKHQATAPTQESGGVGGTLQDEATDTMQNARPGLGGILGKILGGLGR